MSGDKGQENLSGSFASRGLACDLGAIASGEMTYGQGVQVPDEINASTARFATGLLRLIDERIAAALVDPGEPSACASCEHVYGPGHVAAPCRHQMLAKELGHPEPYRVPAPGIVAVGDTFLRLTPDGDRWRVGDRVGVSGWRRRQDANDVRDAIVTGAGLYGVVMTADLLHSGDWQRVPAGYVLPTVMQCLATMRRLIAARDRMSADPTTGTTGIDDCIAEMRLLAGMVAT